jgi:hypothetical protein
MKLTMDLVQCFIVNSVPLVEVGFWSIAYVSEHFVIHKKSNNRADGLHFYRLMREISSISCMGLLIDLESYHPKENSSVKIARSGCQKYLVGTYLSEQCAVLIEI